MRRAFPLLLTLLSGQLVARPGTAQQPPSQFKELRWRSIGPFRANRTQEWAGGARHPQGHKRRGGRGRGTDTEG